MQTEENIKKITEQQLKTFDFTCDPKISAIKKLGSGWAVNIMWGFDNEGIRILILDDMPDRLLPEHISNKIKKDLNGIRCYSRHLYDRIIK